jgi:outer membrane lipoprotein-sorting protein
MPARAMSVMLCAMLSVGPAGVPADAAGTGAAERPAGASPDSSGAAALERVAAQYAEVRDYVVTLHVTTNIERMSVPPMNATMYFKAPDKVHFDAKGFAILPREGLTFNPAMLSERFTVDATVADTLAGKRMLKLTMKPRSDQARTRRVILYVDPRRWTPEKFTTAGIDGRAMSATFTHTRVDGFWLPSALFVEFSAASDTAAVPQWEQNLPGASGRMPFRGGTIEVKYSGYRVNTGLDDAIFAPPPGTED